MTHQLADLRLAGRVALREMRSGLHGFRIFLACIVLGVGAIAVIGSLSAALERGIGNEGQRLLGGDIQFSIVHEEMGAAERCVSRGARHRQHSGDRALDGAQRRGRAADRGEGGRRALSALWHGRARRRRGAGGCAGGGGRAFRRRGRAADPVALRDRTGRHADHRRRDAGGARRDRPRARPRRRRLHPRPARADEPRRAGCHRHRAARQPDHLALPGAASPRRQSGRRAGAAGRGDRGLSRYRLEHPHPRPGGTRHRPLPRPADVPA
jgi:hypothetical protein